MDIEVRDCNPLWLRRSIRLSSSYGISLPSLPGVSRRWSWWRPSRVRLSLF